MKTTSRIISTSVTAAAILALALPAFAQVSIAQVGVNSSVNVSANADVAPTTAAGIRVRSTAAATTSASSNRGERREGNATSSAERMQNMQNRGDEATARRIDSLNKLAARIQGMKNLSDSEKASLTAQIQASITDMNDIQSEIQSATSTASARADLQMVAPDYRIYMLIMPQVSLLSAVDRVNALVTSLETVQSKIQTRVSADASLSGNTTISADLASMTAKLSDATSQAVAAQAEISGLQPDNGNATVRTSNTAALKDARAKIKTAQQDLQAARKTAGDLVKLIAGKGSASGSATTTVSATTSAQ